MLDKKVWKNNLETILMAEKNYSDNHLNCYIDLAKNTSKVLCCYAHNSYSLSNVIDINSVQDNLNLGVDLIYSKNVAFKILNLQRLKSSSYIYMDNSYFSRFYDAKTS